MAGWLGGCIVYEFLINFTGKDIDYLNLDESQEQVNKIFDRAHD